MRKIEKIEHEIQGLSHSELAAFRRWFREFDAEAWDRKIEEDIQAGKLVASGDAALKSFEAGKCSEIRNTSPPLNFGFAIKRCQSLSKNSPTKASHC